MQRKNLHIYLTYYYKGLKIYTGTLQDSEEILKYPSDTNKALKLTLTTKIQLQKLHHIMSRHTNYVPLGTLDPTAMLWLQMMTTGEKGTRHQRCFCIIVL